MILVQAKVYINTVYLSFDEDFYYNERADGLKLLIQCYVVVQGMQMVMFFQTNLIILELIRSKGARKQFVLVMFFQVSIMYIKTLAFFDNDEEQGGLMTVIIAFGTSAYMAVNAFFTYCIFNLQTLSEEAIELEMAENHKYKFMFNTI